MTDRDPSSEVVLDELEREECLELLGTQSVGRLAVADHGFYPPHIVPVSFMLDGDAVVFRSDVGLKFRLSVLAEHSVSFEADVIDAEGQVAWSVVVQGRGELLDPEKAEALAERSWFRPRAPGDRSQWIRIAPYTITGRRIRNVSVSPCGA